MLITGIRDRDHVYLPRFRMTWTDKELANLFHLPPADHPIYQEPADRDDRGYLVHLAKGQRALSDWELNDGVYIGEVIHPLQQRPARIYFEQLTKHFICTGPPGMGKSSMMVEMIQSILEM